MAYVSWSVFCDVLFVLQPPFCLRGCSDGPIQNNSLISAECQGFVHFPIVLQMPKLISVLNNALKTYFPDSVIP